MKTFYQYTTGILLLSVAVSLSIYRDTYRIALHVSRYVSYRMIAVSSQPYNDDVIQKVQRHHDLIKAHALI